MKARSPHKHKITTALPAECSRERNSSSPRSLTNYTACVWWTMVHFIWSKTALTLSLPRSIDAKRRTGSFATEIAGSLCCWPPPVGLSVGKTLVERREDNGRNLAFDWSNCDNMTIWHMTWYLERYFERTVNYCRHGAQLCCRTNGEHVKIIYIYSVNT